MIPKVIHYCWFGGAPKPLLAIKCIESWKKFCPDWEIREWNEDNCDVNAYAYTKEAYIHKKWGFVSDVFRLKIIYDYGGVYLDTDVELLRPLDDLMQYDAFMGCEDFDFVALGLGFGAKQHHNFIKRHFDYYMSKHFTKPDGTLDLTPIPVLTSSLLKEYGVVFPITKPTVYNEITIFPPSYFSPKSWKTGKVKITKDSFSIHHYMASWCDTNPTEKYIEYMRKSFWKRMLVRIFGMRFCKIIKSLFQTLGLN